MRFGLAALSLLLVMSCSDDNSNVADGGGKLDGVVADGPTIDGLAVDGHAADGHEADGLLTDIFGTLDHSPNHDGINITCGAQVGTATTSGTVGGKPIGATHAGGVSVSLSGLSGFGIALLDQGGTCSQLAAAMSTPKLWLLLCDNKPGVHTIGTNCLGGSGGISFKNQASIPQPGADIKASGGTITITTLDAACGKQVKGSFKLQFGADEISGSFDSVGCGAISM